MNKKKKAFEVKDFFVSAIVAIVFFYGKTYLSYSDGHYFLSEHAKYERWNLIGAIFIFFASWAATTVIGLITYYFNSKKKKNTWEA